jgi:hypothetical protein
VITRIAALAPPVTPLYQERLKGIRVEAIALDYDHRAWTRDFLANWPKNSPAHLSYWSRIQGGPSHRLIDAAPRADVA